VASAEDGGFVVAATAPNELLRYSTDGAPVGAPVALMGDPVFASRTPTQTIIVTRAPDGVTVLNRKDQRIVDTFRLNPATFVPLPKEVRLSKPSSDIQSVAVGSRGMLWAVTGERDGDAAVLRFRQEERRWEVPTWALRTDGLVGGDARGLVLRLINGDLWAVSANSSPASLYHFVDFTRIDEFSGHELQMVSCAHDVAESAAGNLLVLSCSNELQELSVEGKTLTLVASRPTLPSESGPGKWTDELIMRDSATVVIALNTEIGQPNNRPAHARVAEVDSLGKVTQLLDVPDAVVRSMAVTPRLVAVVLQRANGSMDGMWIPRRR
jgi:hypothetical protein